MGGVLVPQLCAEVFQDRLGFYEGMPLPGGHVEICQQLPQGSVEAQEGTAEA